MNGPVSKLARCAIYTRKSTEYNLELAFNSLDAQREACEAYIKSQAHEGWRLIPGRYDDGAFSGASLDRPALQQLLADVRASKIDIVLVYKVDRLTRSLADFAKLIELFDVHGVSFVSVTQSFNTSSSMGRLTLNVLLSFAQFERELIGERVRDKIAASKRKGLWVGGPVPLGYAAVDKKILVVPAEAAAVRTIFARYLELGSVRALAQDLDRRGIRSKPRRRSTGRTVGGGRFGVGALAYLLKNRFYIGEVVYRGEVHHGEHEPILDSALFEAVEAKLAAHASARPCKHLSRASDRERHDDGRPLDQPRPRRRQGHHPCARAQHADQSEPPRGAPDRDRQGPPMDRRFGARPRCQLRPDCQAGRKGRAAHPAVGTARLRLTPDRVGTPRRHRAGRSHPHKARPRAALLLG